MISNTSLTQIKTDVQENLGQRVKLTSKKGNKKMKILLGVIESIHPSIFTVKLDSSSLCATGNEVRRVSYSYADVLTKNIEISPCHREEIDFAKR